MWEVGAIIVIIVAVDLCAIGTYKALRRARHSGRSWQNFFKSNDS